LFGHSTVNVVSFCVVFLYNLSSPLASMLWQITQECNTPLTAPNFHVHTNVSNVSILLVGFTDPFKALYVIKLRNIKKLYTLSYNICVNSHNKIRLLIYNIISRLAFILDTDYISVYAIQMDFCLKSLKLKALMSLIF